MVFFRYAYSMLSSVIGLDLLAVYVINTYVSYCQKLDKKEKMRTVTSESSLHWEFQTIQQTIERFQSERKKKKGVGASICGSSSISTRSNPGRQMKHLRRGGSKLWMIPTITSYLPTTASVSWCKSEELCASIRIVYTLRCISVLVSYFFAFLCIGHMFTAVGRKLRLVILRKNAIFFGACVGFWTDETYDEAYDIDGLVKELTISLATRRRLLCSSPRRSLLAELSCCRR